MSRLLAAAAALVAAQGIRAAEVEVAYGRDHLDRGYGAWQVATVEAAGAPAARTEVRGGLRATERFGLRDLELSGAFAWKRLPRWTLGAAASLCPTHRVLPAATAGVDAARELGGGLVASAGARWAEYRTAAGRSEGGVGSAGLEWYRGEWRLAATAYAAALGGAWAGAGRAAADWLYGEEGRAGLALAAGTDLESTGQRILRTPVRFAGLSGRHPLGGGWSVSWELSAQQQGRYYTRLGGRLGVRRRF